MFCSTKYKKVGLVAFSFLFFKDCAFSVKDKSSGGQAGTDIFFALPNDTNTISWLSEQIESHSFFLSLTLYPCLSVSLCYASLSSLIDYHVHIHMLQYIDV